MAKVTIGWQNALRVTIMVAVTAYVLRRLADATGVGRPLTAFLP